ncbi:hypothetical protein CI610_00543 [invertebrate metagenome]|uniref:Uncharacterized protein n=1 Tax=invertebrate metagenome TaxID=1711999 RepID=A0A2H9TB40_9ZZZZ
MNEQTVKKLALIIAANCTRDSMLDECQENGQLNQEQVQAFNKQMTDRIYTFLTYLLNKPASEYSVMMEALAKHYPESWPMPEIYQQFTLPPDTSDVAAQAHS